MKRFILFHPSTIAVISGLIGALIGFLINLVSGGQADQTIWIALILAMLFSLGISAWQSFGQMKSEEQFTTMLQEMVFQTYFLALLADKPEISQMAQQRLGDVLKNLNKDQQVRMLKFFSRSGLPANIVGDALRGTQALAGADLRQILLRKINLEEANLSRVNFSEADLSEAHLILTYLEHANLTGANLSGATFRQADFSRAILKDANLSGADLSEVVFLSANLTGANLSGATLRRAIMNDANLQGANLTGTDLWEANLLGADLTGAILDEAELAGTLLTEEQLSKTQSRKNIRSKPIIPE